MMHNELINHFLLDFAKSKGITIEQMISVEITAESLIYKFVDLENKTLNTVQELKPNV